MDFFQSRLDRIGKRDKLLREKIGPIEGGAILRSNANARWVLVTPDPDCSGKWRLTFFDLDGFSGHQVYASFDAALSEAFMVGFHDRDDAALDQLQITTRFCRGNLMTDLVRRINAGELTHASAAIELKRFDSESTRLEFEHA